MSISSIYSSSSAYQNTSTAAKNPTAVAIDQSTTSQANGLEKGSENISSTQDLLKTADGAASSVSDMLQNIRDLAVKALNGTYSASDKQNMQDEIEQLKSGIDETLKNTNYNTISVFENGYNGNTQVNTTGTNVSVDAMSLDSLGISDFNVTDSSTDISVIDKAIQTVSNTRSSIGSQDNALSYMKANTENARTQTLSSKDDLYQNLVDDITAFKKNSYLEQYRLTMERKQIDSQKNALNYTL